MSFIDKLTIAAIVIGTLGIGITTIVLPFALVFSVLRTLGY